MKNLADIAQDRYSNQVLQALEQSRGNSENDFLLTKLRTGSLSLRQFGLAMKARLDASTHFVPFLSATEEKIRSNGQWPEMSLALRENLNEELGMEHETYNKQQEHGVWREEFRSGLARVLQEEGVNWQRIDANDIRHEIEIQYGERVRKMPQEKSIYSLAGAFTVLEGILEKEFLAIHDYIKLRLKNRLEPKELKYISHHAGHEHRHFDDVAEPLLRKCASSPHVVPEVIEGIRDMAQWRLKYVLSTINRCLE